MQRNRDGAKDFEGVIDDSKSGDKKSISSSTRLSPSLSLLLILSGVCLLRHSVITYVAVIVSQLAMSTLYSCSYSSISSISLRLFDVVQSPCTKYKNNATAHTSQVDKQLEIASL